MKDTEQYTVHDFVAYMQNVPNTNSLATAYVDRCMTLLFGLSRKSSLTKSEIIEHMDLMQDEMLIYDTRKYIYSFFSEMDDKAESRNVEL